MILLVSIYSVLVDLLAQNHCPAVLCHAIQVPCLEVQIFHPQTSSSQHRALKTPNPDPNDQMQTRHLQAPILHSGDGLRAAGLLFLHVEVSLPRCVHTMAYQTIYTMCSRYLSFVAAAIPVPDCRQETRRTLEASQRSWRMSCLSATLLLRSRKTSRRRSRRRSGRRVSSIAVGGSSLSSCMFETTLGDDVERVWCSIFRSFRVRKANTVSTCYRIPIASVCQIILAVGTDPFAVTNGWSALHTLLISLIIHQPLAPPNPHHYIKH